MQYSGTIVDSQSGAPIQSATVRYSANGTVLDQQITDSAGKFTSYTYLPADQVTVTSAGYKGMSWPASAYQNKFELERNVIMLPPAVVTSHSGGKFPIALALLPLLFIKGEKGKKKIAGVDPNLLLIGGGGLLAFSLVNKLFTSTGIWAGQGTIATQHEQANPNSPWKPAFWKNAPPGTSITLLTVSAVDQFATTINNALGFFTDDFDAIMGVFSQLKTKSQVSYLADKFQQKYGRDLLTYLKDGGSFSLPWDGLSEGHLKILVDLVNNLPQYNPR